MAKEITIEDEIIEAFAMERLLEHVLDIMAAKQKGLENNKKTASNTRKDQLTAPAHTHI